MKLAILTLLTLAATVPSARAETDVAQGGAFDGPFVSAQFGAQRASAVETNVRTTVPGSSFDQPAALGKGGVLQIHGGYGRDLGGMFNMAVGGFAELSGGGLEPTQATALGDVVEQEIANRVGLYLAPGVYVDPRTLVYAKVGLSQADHRYNRPTRGVALSERISGQMFGIGMKRMLDDHMFWSVDYTRVDYGLAQLGTAVPLAGFVGNFVVDVRGRAITEEVSVGFGYQF